MYNVATWPNDNKTGGVTLKAAGLVGADTNETVVALGKGKYRIVLDWTACETASTDEFYNIFLEANSKADTTTYYKIAPLGCYGAAAATGDTVTPASGSVEVIVDNPLDHQIRVVTKVNGTIGSGGINFSVAAYPLSTKY